MKPLLPLAIVALAGLAGGLEIDTIAEGIESEGEAEVLLAQGWRHGQGWLFGPAAPLDREDS